MNSALTRVRTLIARSRPISVRTLDAFVDSRDVIDREASLLDAPAKAELFRGGHRRRRGWKVNTFRDRTRPLRAGTALLLVLTLAGCGATLPPPHPALP